LIKGGHIRKPRGKFKSGKKSDWEKIKPPSWVIKKMKKRRSNHVNGEHYRYKREKGKYYRKKK